MSSLIQSSQRLFGRPRGLHPGELSRNVVLATESSPAPVTCPYHRSLASRIFLSDRCDGHDLADGFVRDAGEESLPTQLRGDNYYLLEARRRKGAMHKAHLQLREAVGPN